MKSNEEILSDVMTKIVNELKYIGFQEHLVYAVVGTISLPFTEALQAKDEAHKAEMRDVLWRVKDIREMLQTEHSYGLDEWSPPVKNLKILEEQLTKLNK